MEVLLNDLSAECSLAERGVAADAVDWRLRWLMGTGQTWMKSCSAHNTLLAGSPTAAMTRLINAVNNLLQR